MRRLAALAAGALLLLVSGCGGSGNSITLTGSGPVPTASPPSLGSLSSSGAGHSFYEIYEPVGPVRGTMLLVHGGAWQDNRGTEGARFFNAEYALTLRAAGWRVVNISYSQGYRPAGPPNPVPMLRDVVAFYDQVRSAFGGPVCAYGQSAGGHLTGMLAAERPNLTCAVLDAAPTDLPTMLHHSNARGYVEHTFGTNPSTLAQWSPARVWRKTIHTPVYATFARTDPTVPPQQGDALKAADPKANISVLPSGTFRWLHTFVDLTSLENRDLTGLIGWLKGITKPTSNAPGTGTDVGSGCDVPPPAGQRSRLMLAGDAWQPQSSWVVGQSALIAATRGCSGAAYYQDDGISIWAWSSAPTPLAAGQTASLTLAPGRAISQLSVSFRGFLANPQDWNLGLYASTSTTGPVSTPVATCDRGNCTGLGLFKTSSGSLLTTSGSHSNPDQSSKAPSATFTVPSGTVRVAWQLECAASSGCPLQSIAHPRARDPLGQPAIFSIYSADAR